MADQLNEVIAAVLHEQDPERVAEFTLYFRRHFSVRVKQAFLVWQSNREQEK
jgi:hypothetical protein